jgi:hypothetical protein
MDNQKGLLKLINLCQLCLQNINKMKKMKILIMYHHILLEMKQVLH